MRGVRAILLLALLGTGCALEPAPEPVTLESWQKNLEQYVWNEANGDPNVLRDMSWDDVHRGFAIMSDPLPQRSTDAIGLLVAHGRIEDQPAFVFLFALVRDRVPIEMRAVFLSVQAGQFHWLVGEQDPVALELYRRNWSGPGFPRLMDTFKVESMGGRVSIAHEQSGARWSVAVGATSRPAATGP
jgi:hypothetical protein